MFASLRAIIMIEIFVRLYKILLAQINSFPGGKGLDEAYINEDWGNNAKEVQEADLAQYYASLEIPYGADLKEAKAAWRKMMKKYHPDLYSNDPERYKTATILTQELTRAYKEIEKAHYNKKKGGPY